MESRGEREGRRGPWVGGRGWRGSRADKERGVFTPERENVGGVLEGRVRDRVYGRGDEFEGNDIVFGEFGGMDNVGGDSVERIAGGVPTCMDWEGEEGIERFVASCREMVGGEEPVCWKMC